MLWVCVCVQYSVCVLWVCVCVQYIVAKALCYKITMVRCVCCVCVCLCAIHCGQSVVLKVVLYAHRSLAC